jgi:hypothetical protein
VITILRDDIIESKYWSFQGKDPELVFQIHVFHTAAHEFVALALPLQYWKSRRDYNVERRHLGISLLDKRRGD